MSDHKAEGVPSGFAETTVVKANLNVGVFGDEFNVFIERPKDTSSNAFESFVNWIFFVTDLFILINHVLEYDSNECDQSNKE